MIVLQEFVPKRDFLKVAEEVRDLVDGWNVTDNAFGLPAPSGTAIGCVLKTRYPDKLVVPIFTLRYKALVEVGGLALAAEAVGLDGLVLTMGDLPKYGEPVKDLRSSEEARDFLREKVGVNLKLGCLLTPRRRVEEAIERVRGPWDFAFFIRLEEGSMPKLERLAEECKRLKKPIYSYLLVETEENSEVVKLIGWPSMTIDQAEEFASRLEGIVDGVVASCAGDRRCEVELLKRLQKFRGRHEPIRAP